MSRQSSSAPSCQGSEPWGSPKARRGNPGTEAAISLRIPLREPGRHWGLRLPPTAKSALRLTPGPTTSLGLASGPPPEGTGCWRRGPTGRRRRAAAPPCQKGRATLSLAWLTLPSAPVGTGAAASSPHACPSVGRHFRKKEPPAGGDCSPVCGTLCQQP